MGNRYIDHVAVPQKPRVTDLLLTPKSPRVWSPLHVEANTANAPAAILDRITWTVRLDGVPTSSSVSIRHNKLKIARIPDDWFGKQVEVSAGFPGQTPVFQSFSLDQCEVAEYVALVRNVEAAYPAWSAERVLGALRRHAGVGSAAFQDVLFGTTSPLPEELKPAGTLTKADIARIIELSAHGDAGGGTATDNSETPVALGHVLIGMAAGMHRKPTSSAHLWKAPLPIKVDSLFFVTIAGDLGQSVVARMGKMDKLPTGDAPPPRVGAGSEASDPELIGDIDGVVLGSRVTTSPGSLTSVSKVLHDYYCAQANTRGGVTANQRFRNFATLRSSTMDVDVLEFANAYYRSTHKAKTAIVGLLAPVSLALDAVSRKDVWETVAAFDAWFKTRKKKEEDQEREADAADKADVAAGWP